MNARAGRPWLISAGATLVAGAASLIAFAPRFWFWPEVGRDVPLLLNAPELNRAFFSLRQLHAPWEPIQHFSNQVLNWRLWWPVLGHYSGMPDRLFLALPFIGSALTVAGAAALVYRRTRDPIVTAAAAILLTTSSWYFVSTGWLAYSDSWTIGALLIASFAPSRTALLMVGAIAPWIDERFILALPFCALARAASAGEGESDASGASGRFPTWVRDSALVFVATAPYLAVRGAAELFGIRQGGAAYLAGHLAVQPSLSLVAEGLWQGVRFGWVFVMLASVAAWRGGESPRPGAATVAAVAVAIFAALASLTFVMVAAGDLSRSASVVTPLVLAGLFSLHQVSPRRARLLAAVCCVGNLLTPAEHVVTTFQRQLRPLSAELGAQASRPPVPAGPVGR